MSLKKDIMVIHPSFPVTCYRRTEWVIQNSLFFKSKIVDHLYCLLKLKVHSFSVIAVFFYNADNSKDYSL